MNYSELVERALKRLEELGMFDRISRFKGLRGGCESGQTSVTNRKYFDQLYLKMSLIGSIWADTSTELFGSKLSTPIMSGAMNEMSRIGTGLLQKMAKGLAEAGSMLWVGGGTNEQLRPVFKEKVPVVKISKPWSDDKLIIERIGYAEDHGAVAVGTDISHCFFGKVGDNLRLESLVRPKTIDNLKDIISTVSIPFVIKGVLSPEDAIKARETGAKALVVSNHGAAALDHAAHPLQILPEVTETIGDELDILVDSGFRRGTDVLMGLALGAKGVLMGTNTLMGLLANEAEGVKDMFKAVTDELRRAMSITGCATIKEINQNILVL